MKYDEAQTFENGHTPMKAIQPKKRENESALASKNISVCNTSHGILNKLVILACIGLFVTVEKTVEQQLNNANYLKPIFPPSTSKPLEQHSKTTVWFLPGSEVNCDYQFNYVCKFWFYVRCIVFKDISNFKIMTSKQGGLSKTLTLVQPGDVIITVWRFGKHKDLPPSLERLVSKQKNQSSIVSKIRFGVLHIAPERGRSDWPWYSLPHFIIRPYWVNNPPIHVQYIPLGPQLPHACHPGSIFESTVSSNSTSHLIKSKDVCTCSESLILKRASKRKYLWSFSGSLRSKRNILVNELNKSNELRGIGKIEIASRFGGDGVFGSANIEENPKTKHLQLIQDSMFVFAPCGNVMETHTIYEAIVLGAIPVIEGCDSENYAFFPYSSVIVKSPIDMIKYVESYVGRFHAIDKLQQNLLAWWQTYSEDVARNVSKVIFTNVPHNLRTAI